MKVIPNLQSHHAVEAVFACPFAALTLGKQIGQGVEAEPFLLQFLHVNTLWMC